MIYPKFIKKGDNIGICALSAGVGKKLDDYLNSLEILKKEGFNIIETKSVRNNSERSTNALDRAKELDELVLNKDVDMILLAAGGDSQLETVPYINYENIKDNPKWILGYSDPTNLLLPVTTMLDIATIYGFNGGSYNNNYDLDQINNLNIIKGDLVKQENFDYYIDFLDTINEIENKKEVLWKGNDLNVSGRIIGGCLDVLDKLVGNKHNHINDFIERYKVDGIIWYFDIFAYSPYETYLTLLQFKNAGYFKYAKAILIGRVAIPNNEDSKLINDYDEAYKLAFEDIPYIYDLDIGHSKPRMTIINGAIAHINYKNHKGSIEFELK